MRPKVEISVWESGSLAARTLSIAILCDGEAVAYRTLTPVEAQEAKEISRQYASLFEKGCRADEVSDYLAILGSSLFRLFFEKTGKPISREVSQSACITISSEIAEILQLPWELLSFESGSVASDIRFAFRRHPKGKCPAVASDKPPQGPLSVLFMACEPKDYEMEERSILQASAALSMIIEIADNGTWREAMRLMKRARHHVVHLAGQVKMREGKSRYSFEGRGVRADLRSPEELGEALVEGGCQCVLLSGCQRENPSALDLFCQQLASYVPIAIGWNTSADLAQAFYESLARGLSIDQSLSQARKEIFSSFHAQRKIYPFPILYSNTDLNHIFDALKQGPVVFRREELWPLPGMADGYAESFVGRRSDLQRLLPALEEGSVRSVILTGQDGSGKSTLATMLTRRLAAQGRLVIPVYCSSQNPVSATRILETAISAMNRAMPLEAQKLKNPGAPLRDRLSIMLDIINRGRCVLFLDGLGLDDRGRIIDDDLGKFYLSLLRALEGGRAIVTCVKLPADAMTLPKGAWEWPLGPLSLSDFIKFLLQDEILAERYRQGDLSYHLLKKSHEASAGQPACLAHMRAALRMKMDIVQCQQAVADIFGTLDRDSQIALKNASIYEIAVNTAGLAMAAGLSAEKIAERALEWTNLSFARRIGDLLIIAPSLRRWLSREVIEQKEAHLRAGSFLRDLSESGHSPEIGLSRLDCLLEARGHLLISGEIELARQVTARISGYLEHRGYHQEILRLNQELMRSELHVQPMIWMAKAHLDSGDYHKAQEAYEAILELGPDSAAYQGLGTAHFIQGRQREARENFQKAAEICRANGDLGGEASALRSLVSVEVEERNDQAALERLERVLEIQKSLADLRGEAATLSDMASIYSRQNNGDKARQKLAESLEIMQKEGERAGQASALFSMASIDLENGKLDLARKEFNEALGLKQDLGDSAGEAAILHSLGSLEAQAGDKEKAKESFQNALRIFQDLDDKPGEAGAFFQLGALAVQENKVEEGIKLMALSAIILRGLKSEEVKMVEPLVERLAGQLNYSQTQFMEMVRTVASAYRKDRGWRMVQLAVGKAGSG